MWIPLATLSDGINGGLAIAVNATLDQVVGHEVTIPLYDRDLSTDDQYIICGYGQMVINEYNVETNPKSFSVEFKPWVILSDGINNVGPDFGVSRYQTVPIGSRKAMDLR